MHAFVVALCGSLSTAMAVPVGSVLFRSKVVGRMNVIFEFIKHNLLAILTGLVLVAVTSLFFYRDEGKELLKACAEENGVGKAKELLDGGVCDVNHKSRGTEATTPLVCAVAYRRADIVKLLLSRGAAVELQDEERGNPLHVACSIGDAASVRVLLAAGSDALLDSKRTRDFASPLHLAAASGHLEVCELLVARGCDVGWKNAKGVTAVSLTVEAAARHLLRREGYVDGDGGQFVRILQLLCKAGADVDEVNGRGWTLLMIAARSGLASVVEALLLLKASVDRTTPSGLTALMAACAGPHPAVVKVLLSKGARVALSGRDVNTSPLLAAVQAASIAAAVASANAMRGLSPMPPPVGPGPAADMGEDESETTECDDEAPVHAEDNSIEARQTRTVALLLEKGANAYVNHKYKGGNTVLMMAANGAHLGSVQLLLRAGADVHAVRDDGWTALIAAADGGSCDILAALLAAKARPELCSKAPKHWTALHAAVARGDETAVDMLLAAGATATGIPPGGLGPSETAGPSPLHIAAYEGLVGVVRALLDAGASLESRDNKGNTPLCAAVRGAVVPTRRHDDCVGGETTESVQLSLADSLVLIQLLIDRGADMGATNEDGFNPAAIAAIVGVTPALKLLLKAKEGVLPTGNMSWSLRFFVARIRTLCFSPASLTTAHRNSNTAAAPE